MDFLLFNQNDQAQVPVDDVIDAESNLSSDVLQNLLFTVGLPYDSKWETEALLINGSLLEKRNRIAHGQADEVDPADYATLHAMVVELLDHLKLTIENHAAARLFCR